MPGFVEHFRDLDVYKEALAGSGEIFKLSRRWPHEEKRSLTDQIRRCSRSVCANIAEAWDKRFYPKHFASKLTDAKSEASEVQSWLDIARNDAIISPESYRHLDQLYAKIKGGLTKMIRNPDRWSIPPKR